jgi:hypothetical protein
MLGHVAPLAQRRSIPDCCGSMLASEGSASQVSNKPDCQRVAAGKKAVQALLHIWCTECILCVLEAQAYSAGVTYWP